MRYIFFILTLLIINGCGQCPKSEPKINEAFVFFVQEFEKYQGHKIYKTSSIEFSEEIKYPMLAACIGYTDGTRLIEVNPGTWWNITVNQKRVLMLHELLHCELDRDHLDDLLPNGKPASIMNSHLININLDDPIERDYYIKEAFGRNKYVY